MMVATIEEYKEAAAQDWLPWDAIMLPFYEAAHPIVMRYKQVYSKDFETALQAATEGLPQVKMAM